MAQSGEIRSPSNLLWREYPITDPIVNRPSLWFSPWVLWPTNPSCIHYCCSHPHECSSLVRKTYITSRMVQCPSVIMTFQTHFFFLVSALFWNLWYAFFPHLEHKGTKYNEWWSFLWKCMNSVHKAIFTAYYIKNNMSSTPTDLIQHQAFSTSKLLYTMNTEKSIW